MSETNKRIARQFIEALGKSDAAALKTLVTQDIEAIATGTSIGSGSRGYAQIVAAFEMFGKATRSGLNPKFLTITAEDDRVAIEWEGECTLVNGVPYNNQYCTMFFLRDGKIYKLKEYFDTKLTDATLGPLMAGATVPQK
ncbi:MAG TPA: nuclear transport factor 2 family protein [Steroidobacteraceae bacterium]|nr:nuclear transport factor 2 family protein [Steroidobacteraceae bacterium]